MRKPRAVPLSDSFSQIKGRIKKKRGNFSLRFLIYIITASECIKYIVLVPFSRTGKTEQWIL